MPESGGADTGVRKMAAAQDSRAWPRPRPRGLHTCTVGQMVAAGCVSSQQLRKQCTSNCVF